MTAHPPERFPASKPRLRHTKPLINGAVAGPSATAPVTLLMFGGHRNLAALSVTAKSDYQKNFWNDAHFRKPCTM